MQITRIMQIGQIMHIIYVIIYINSNTTGFTWYQRNPENLVNQR